MIYLVTGVPGSGKSLHVVSWIEKWLAEGRAVYADIDGLDMTRVGVQPHAGESPRDWRETPEGSVVIYDEAQGKFPSTGKPGRPDDPVLTAMEEHRHSGHDLVFMTQNATMVHHHVRKLVGQHVHVARAFGGNAAAVFTWGEQVDERDRGERHKADKQTWTYPKRLFRAYKSATVHTHRFRMPRKILFISVVIALLIGGTTWMGLSAFDSFRGATGTDQPAPGASQTTAGPQQVSQVRASGTSRTAHMGGAIPASLAGAPVSDSWRLAGSYRGDGQAVYFLRGRGDRSLTVPTRDGAFQALKYDRGILTVRGPGGRFRVTPYTGPEIQRSYEGGRAIGGSDRRSVPPQWKEASNESTDLY